jgi:protein arginine kinase
VILSTRVRVARNLDHFPFPHHANPFELEAVADLVSSIVNRSKTNALKSFRSFNVSSLSDTEKAALVDSHLVSLLHATSGPHRIALVDEQHSNSILINEEDHIRIQTILPGLMPDSAWREAERIEDALAHQLHPAYHPKYGYLTASLANTGTGMRVSFMAHVPALAFLERLNKTWFASEGLGSSVRGLYGEGGAGHGDVYQVSNASAIGTTENGIVGRMTAVALHLQTEEIFSRHVVKTNMSHDVQRLVDEQLAKLENAAALTVEEAMKMLSALRLGELIGIKTSVSHRMFCEMVVGMQGSIGSIAVKKNRARDVFYEDTRRPALLRNRLRRENSTSKANRSS